VGYRDEQPTLRIYGARQHNNAGCRVEHGLSLRIAEWDESLRRALAPYRGDLHGHDSDVLFRWSEPGVAGGELQHCAQRRRLGGWIKHGWAIHIQWRVGRGGYLQH